MARNPASPNAPPRAERARRSRRQVEAPAAGDSVAGEEDPGAALDDVPAGDAATANRPTLKAPIATGKPPLAPGAPATQPALPLPHERDESIGSAPATPDPTIEQARRDIESGQVDTDLRNPSGIDAEQRKRLLRDGSG